MVHHFNTSPDKQKPPVPAPNAENTCAIVVTYHPGPGTLGNLAAIVPQMAHVVVVDNGSGPAELEMLRRLAASNSKITLLENGENLGIATALNRGMEWALKNKYAWTISFDQDSTADPNLLSEVAENFEQLSPAENVGAIGVNARNEMTGRPVHPSKAADRFFIPAKTVITSGCFFPTQTFEEIGRFKDEYFIDCVDHEFCLRLRRNGYKVLVTTVPLMVHRLGQELPDVPWGHGIHMTALRRYYVTRNMLLLAREYMLREPAWVLSSVVRTIVLAPFIKILFEQDRGKKLRAIILGVWHGLTGRTGKLREG